MDRGPDRPGPRAELGGHDLDLGQRRRVHAVPHLRPDRVEQEVAGRRDAAADDDPVGRQDGDHVADPDAEIAADLGQPGQCPGVAGPGRFDRRLGRRGPARRGDPVGTRERLETAVVAAAARRPIRIDRLVPDLAGRAVVPEHDPAVDRDHPTDARPEGEADHRRRPAARPEAELRQPERAGVVDQVDGDAEDGRHRGRDRTARPVAGMLTRNRVVPATGSYSPGTPTPSDRIRGRRSIALRPVSAIRPMTASGPSPEPVGTCP